MARCAGAAAPGLWLCTALSARLSAGSGTHHRRPAGRHAWRGALAPGSEFEHPGPRKMPCRFRMPSSISSWWCMGWRKRRACARCSGNCGGCWHRKAGCCWWRPTAPACGPRCERSPFGQGRPFSRNELETLLRGALFVPEKLAARALCAARRDPGAHRQWHGLGKDRLALFLQPGRRSYRGSGKIALCPGHAQACCG